MGTGAALPLGRQLEQDFQENIFLLLSFILHHIHICFGNMIFLSSNLKRQAMQDYRKYLCMKGFIKQAAKNPDLTCKIKENLIICFFLLQKIFSKQFNRCRTLRAISRKVLS